MLSIAENDSNMKRRKEYFFLLLMLSYGAALSHSTDKKKQCNSPLLTKSEVPDSNFKASSSYSTKFSAAHARVSNDREKGHSAWCPKSSVGRETSEYIQIDFQNLKRITLIETRGRFAEGKGKEFVPFYILKYQRENISTWFEYKDINQVRKMKGSDDTRTPAHLAMKPYIIAKRIRLYPYSDPPRFVCVRLEIYGCDFTDGVVEYLIPIGDKFSDDISYTDYTYDGVVVGPSRDLLANGLGQLTDGIVMRIQGENDPYQTKQIGYYYVGWKKRAPDQPVVLVFRFDMLRRFQMAKFHSSNRRSKDICIFSTAKFTFDRGGNLKKRDIQFNYSKDEMMEVSRFVPFNLKNYTAIMLRVELWFECDWILLDEVRFISTPYKGGPPVPETLPSPNAKKKAVVLPTTASAINRPIRQDRNGASQITGGVYPREPDRKEPPFNDYPGNDWSYLIAVVCILVGACFVVAVVSFVCIRRRRSRSKKKAAAKQMYMSPMGQPYKAPASVVGVGSIRPAMTLNMRADHPGLTVDNNVVNEASLYTSLPSDDGTVGGCGGPGSDVTYASASGSFASPYSHTNGVNGLGTAKRMKSIDKPGSFWRLAQRVLSGLNSNMGAEYASTALFGTPPPSYATSVGGGLAGGPGVYSKPQIIQNPMADLLEGPYSSASSSSPYSRPAGTLPLPHSLLRFPPDLSIQGVCGNTVYTAPCDLDLQSTPLNKLPIREVSSSRLTFLEKLGGGQFGEVHLAQLRPASPPTPEEYEKVDLMEAKAAEEGDDKIEGEEDKDEMNLVAVKVLRPDTNEAGAKHDFQNEIRILSRLNHKNVVRLIGVCSDKDTLSMLVEYMKYGDLNQFLQGHYPTDLGTNGQTVHPSTKTLSYGSLIYMAMQIANGMKYLESLNIFHRDLACRNCLVGSQYSIKISDFGMCRRLYTSDYYRFEGRMVLSIRWSSWESLLMGKFSSKSDVWSFGVSLWEILTFCRQQPFSRLTDEEVIKNCTNMYQYGDLSEYLPCPSNCPKEIYDLMLECWNKEEAARPRFREIHMFLQRKNFGYNSKDDYHYQRDKDVTK